MARTNRSQVMRVVAALTTLALATGCSAAPPVLSNIAGVDELKTRFNADAGRPRIILLLSPT